MLNMPSLPILNSISSKGPHRFDLPPSNTPIIAHFKTKNNFYIMDSATNQILAVPQDVWCDTQDTKFWESMERKHKTNNSNYSRYADCIKLVENARNDLGVFSLTRAQTQKSQINASDYSDALQHQLGQLVLEVTQQCNLRCSYCTFSGHYEDQRVHNDTVMDWDTAKKAVDYYLNRIDRTPVPMIGFYGGEPTTRMDLVEKVVDYANSNSNKKIYYNMTTNGFSFSDQTIRFLANHQFSLLVSLDGPKEIHDRYRLTMGGNGSFNKTYSTLHRILAADSTYFGSKVRLSVVVGPPYDFASLKPFFDEDPVLTATAGMRVSLVNKFSTTFFESEKATAEAKNGKDGSVTLYSLREEYKHNLISGQPQKSRFLAALFQNTFIGLHKRRLARGYGESHPLNGSCTPGLKRVFAAATGDFKICERVNESLRIGHVSEGISVSQINDISYKYADLSKNYCLNCYANRNCSACFASNFSTEGFHEDKQQQCQLIRKTLLKDLADYCEVLEENPSAFDFMNQIQAS